MANETFIGNGTPNDTILGNGDDTLYGTAGANTDPGAGGTADNDTLNGAGGNDVIYGGGGDDSLIGGAGYDSIYGGDGNDTIDGSGNAGSNAQYEVLDGGAGDDYIIVGSKTDLVYGGAGNDTVNIDVIGTTGWSYDSANDIWTNSGTAGSDPVSVSGAEFWSYNGNIYITPTGQIAPAEPCFAAGTLIATARGEIPVQDLRVGDLVVTPHCGAPLQPVVWIGHSRVDLSRHPARTQVAPIHIQAGALAKGVPCRDLRVSPEHAIFLDGCLVPARLLLNGTTIVQELWCPEVTYWHVELPAHGLLVSEGATSESYFDDGNRNQFDNYGITTLFKDFGSERRNGLYAKNACHPVLEEGPALTRIQVRLAERAAQVAAERDVA